VRRQLDDLVAKLLQFRSRPAWDENVNGGDVGVH
jgi:hypothetical protein